jgi:hypothetical protein
VHVALGISVIESKGAHRPNNDPNDSNALDSEPSGESWLGEERLSQPKSAYVPGQGDDLRRGRMFTVACGN